VPCRFGPLADDILSELSKALDKRGQPLKKKSVEFVVQIENSPIVIADPFYVYRIAHQLCDNALKFTNEGTVTLTACGSPNHGLKITVSDTGVGFDMAKLEFLFKPLHRLEPDKFYGLGVGLCMVKDMVTRIPGSSIKFNSALGKGTCVTVIIAEGTASPDWSSSSALVASSSPVSLTDLPDRNSVPSSDPNQPVVSTVALPQLQQEPNPPMTEIKVELKPDATAGGEVAVGETSLKTKPIPDIQTAVAPYTAAGNKDVPPRNSESVVDGAGTAWVKQGGESARPTGQAITIANAGADPGTTTTDAPATLLRFVFVDQPEDEEEFDAETSEALASDKGRALVAMDDSSEPPSMQGALSNLSLAVDILKERIAVANAMSSNIKSIISQIDSRYK
jgi:anti-sigma regulatory factor (Ser/Thr protein kinase)